MPGSLEGVHAKLRRAEAHLADLYEMTERTGRACRKAVVREYDHERAHDVFRLMEIPPIDPDFAPILGDAIHNLRTALDHLAWQLVVATGTKPPSEATYFPILEQRLTANRWGVSHPQIPPGVGKPVRERLDLVQPYQRGDPANHPLGILHNLDIRDKHRELVVVLVGARSAAWVGGVDLVEFNPGPYEPGDEVARFVWRGGRRKRKPQFEAHFGFAECIDEAATRALGVTYPAIALLHEQPLAYIRDEVLPRFREFFT